MIKFSKRNEKYACFSNFYPCDLVFNNMHFKNSEAAWQSLKTLDENERLSFQNLGPSEAKKKGRHVQLRKDWELVKYKFMVAVCLAKFRQNPELGEILLGTGDEEILEDTTGWHDNIWGHCECPKCKDKSYTNLLGKALMEARDFLKTMEATGKDWRSWRVDSEENERGREERE